MSEPTTHPDGPGDAGDARTPERLLVAIANHGTKNRRYLDVLLHEYRSMRFDVDLVVLSDQPKDLGDDVRVLVGAPTPDPWSLPFGHRQLFADHVDDYDLFLYTEDDMHVLERHIDAFLTSSARLADDEVPGFLRYEEHPDGRRSLCDLHSGYRWLPHTVRATDGEVFASHTNEHSAFYLLTRAQLRRAIASGGFLVPPHEGRFDLLVTAATDPYTQCGLERRLSVTQLDDILVHHLSNAYLDVMGITEEELEAQRGALLEIAAGTRAPAEALDPDTRLETIAWALPQHPRATEPLRSLVGTARRVLSLGASAGRLERELFPDAHVAAIPADTVVGAVARLHGIETFEPDLDQDLRDLAEPGGRFDVVLLHQTLHRVANPVQLLRRLPDVLDEHGRVVISVPNHRYQRLRRRARRSGVPPLPTGDFARDGLHHCDPAVVRRWARAAGLHLDSQHLQRSPKLQAARWLPGPLDPWLAETIHLVGSFRATG